MPTWEELIEQLRTEEEARAFRETVRSFAVKAVEDLTEQKRGQIRADYEAHPEKYTDPKTKQPYTKDKFESHLDTMITDQEPKEFFDDFTMDRFDMLGGIIQGTALLQTSFDDRSRPADMDFTDGKLNNVGKRHFESYLGGQLKSCKDDYPDQTNLMDEMKMAVKSALDKVLRDSYEIIDDDEFGLEGKDYTRRHTRNEMLAMEKAGDYMGIVDKALDVFLRKQVYEIEEGEEEGIDEYLETFYERRENGLFNPSVRPEKLETYEKINEAMGMKRAELMVLVGKEVDEIREKMKSGEIKGAERWTGDDEALGEIAANYVYMTSKNAYTLEAISNSIVGLTLPAGLEHTNLALKRADDGLKAHVQSIADEKEREQAQKYFDLGIIAKDARASKYGLNIDTSGGADKKTLFNNSQEQIKIQNLQDPEELGKFEAENELLIKKTGDLKELTAKIIKGAKEDLALLDAMTKEGHKDGQEFIKMRNALRDIANLDINGASYEGLKNFTDKLLQTSEKYEETHDVWYRASKGYGKDRLDMSRHLKEMAAQTKEMLGDYPKKIQGRFFIQVEDDLNDNRHMIARARKDMEAKEKNAEDKKPQRRKLDPKEKEEFLKGDAPKRTGRRTVHESSKTQKILMNL